MLGNLPWFWLPNQSLYTPLLYTAQFSCFIFTSWLDGGWVWWSSIWEVSWLVRGGRSRFGVRRKTEKTRKMESQIGGEIFKGSLFVSPRLSVMSFSHVETKMSLATRCAPVQIETWKTEVYCFSAFAVVLTQTPWNADWWILPKNVCVCVQERQICFIWFI